MKLRGQLLGLFSMVLSPMLWAQQAAPSATEPAASSAGTEEKRRPVQTLRNSEIAVSEEVTELSPFVVTQSEDDIGYYAESTLAGSRIKSNLADLASSITVVTRQQMLDTASIDMNDIFLYEANTEGTGNYTSFSFNDQNSVDDGNSRDPSSANRVRGIGSVDRARNYYQSLAGLPFDVYNTETVEINRGPNALLFGIGSAAGIVNQSSSNASLKRKSFEVGARYGSNDSYRGSFRFNQPLIANKLAIFGAGLYDSRGFTRKPSHDISRRGYGALTYAPFKNTSIRANYERFTNDARRPNMITPQDGITEWVAAGRPAWDPLARTYTVNGVTTSVPNTANLINVPGLGQEPLGNRPFLYYDRGEAVLWMQAQLSNTGVQGPFATTLPQLVRSETDEFKLRNTTLPLYRTPGITDRSLYDWGSVNLASSEKSSREADVYNVELDQKITENFFAQLGWYREELDTYQAFANGWQMVRVDPNIKLLDGSANPFFGRPYLSAVSTPNNFDYYINQTFRASFAYSLDFTKNSGWTKWLGKHQFSVIGSRNEQEQLALRMLATSVSNHAWVNPTRKIQGGAAIPAGAIITPSVYLSDSGYAITHDPGYIMREAFDFPLRHALPATGGTYTWQNTPVRVEQAANLNSNRTSKITDSLTLGWQSALLNGRVVPTVGVRRDKNTSRATAGLAVDPATGLANLSGLDTYAVNNVVYGNTRSAGVVIKPLSWINFSYNQSRNFTPVAAQFDLFGNILPLPTGEGKDYGVRFYFLDNKFILGINAYEASADNSRGTPATTFVQRLARIEGAFILWAEGVARSRLGASASDAAIDTEVARITGLPEGFVMPADSTISSTATVKSKGAEIQLIFNPVKNWNIKATAGKQRTTFSAIAPEMEAFTNVRLPIWQAATNTSNALFWTSQVVDPAGGNMNPGNFYTSSVSVPSRLAKASEGKRTQGQREWQANVISTYRFIAGPLKGTEVGGGVRWQDQAIIGYLGGTPDSAGVVRDLDASKPVFDDPEPSVDFWVSRMFVLPKWFGRNVRAKVQLNVRNAFEDGNWLQPVAVNPDGTASTFRIVDPREWQLTTTLFF